MSWLSTEWMLVVGGSLVVLLAPLAWMKFRSAARTLDSLGDLPAAPHIVVLGCPVLAPHGERNRYFDARIEAAAAAYHAADHSSDHSADQVERQDAVHAARPDADPTAKSEPARSRRERPRILCSGWDATGEASEMVEALVRARVPADRIRLDGRAARTLDTIDFVVSQAASEVAADCAAEAIVFVSQGFHLPRVLFLAHRRGLNAWALPAAGTLRGFRSRSREILAGWRAIFDIGFSRPSATAPARGAPPHPSGRPTTDRSQDPS